MLGANPSNGCLDGFRIYLIVHSQAISKSLAQAIPVNKSIMSGAPIPILATGRTEAIGRQVVAQLQPEYEGKHSPTTTPAALLHPKTPN